MSLISRLPLLWKGKAAEGKYRPGPWYTSDGVIAASWGRYANWWQAGYSPQPYGERSAMVEACQAAYSQTVAMLPGDHWRGLANGGRERVSNSALSRILHRPNDYQSISDFLMNLTRALYATGNAYAYAVRNNRAEITELHLMRDGQVAIGEFGSIYYSLSGNEVVDNRFDLSEPVPARDVLHVRLHTPRHPLKGESPILSAALDLGMYNTALQQQVTFFLNQARSSFVLGTDQPMNAEQNDAVRNKVSERISGMNEGLPLILSNGLKPYPLTTSAVDAQLAELLKMSSANIALAHRIPLQVLGLGETTYASTEVLNQAWLSTGLGFTLNHIETAFDNLFRLRGPPDEWTELNTHTLLRSAYRERIEGLARGVISGIYSPDEARASEDLPAVPGGVGSEPRVQMQVVPLSYGADMQPPKPQADQPPPDQPAPPAPTAQDTQRAVSYLRDYHERSVAA
ncbi:MAG TPA: phage portal protein [Bradyrhizobium sp.]|jgi:HK97 family phage portal protein|nr:phage portal protein [Bradyrhizobium sp.]